MVHKFFLVLNFLWLNKTAKYQNKPTLVEDFFNFGGFDFARLLDSDGNIKSHHALSIGFRLVPNNYSFIKHVKLISAVPWARLDETPSTSNTIY